LPSVHASGHTAGCPESCVEDNEIEQVRDASRLVPILPLDDRPRQHLDAVGPVLDGVDLRACP
jgi:hypothetical protein